MIHPALKWAVSGSVPVIERSSVGETQPRQQQPHVHGPLSRALKPQFQGAHWLTRLTDPQAMKSMMG